MPEDLPKEAGIAALIAAIFIFVNLNFGCFYDNDCLHLKMHLRRLKIIEKIFFFSFLLITSEIPNFFEKDLAIRLELPNHLTHCSFFTNFLLNGRCTIALYQRAKCTTLKFFFFIEIFYQSSFFYPIQRHCRA